MNDEVKERQASADLHASIDLDAACAAATERLRRSLNRSVAQHRMHLARLASELRRRSAQ